MRIGIALAGFLLVAGCASSNRSAAPMTDAERSWDWPFETPTWAQDADQAKLASDAENTPTVMLLCEFIDAGEMAPLLADLLDVTPSRATLLNEKQADALREMVNRLDTAAVRAAPRIRVNANQAASVSIVESLGGQRIWVRPTNVTAGGATVQFAVQVVYCEDHRSVNRDCSWGTEGQQTLALGQAVVCMGKSADGEQPMLAVLRLTQSG